MKIKKKAEAFVTKLGEKLCSERVTFSKRQFIKVLQDLPESKLKAELLSDIRGYYDALSRIFESSSLKQEVVRDDSMFPFNLYLSKKKINKRALRECDKEMSMQIYSSFLSQTLGELQSANHLKKLLNQCMPDDDENNTSMPVWMRQVKHVCAVYSGRREPKILQIIMQFFFQNLSEDANTNDILRLETLKDFVISFLTFCLLNDESSKDFSKPNYGDLIAAILASYVEMVLTLSRNMTDKEKKCTSKQLCARILHFIKPHYNLGMDIIIQVDNVSAADCAVIGPVCRKILEIPTGFGEPAVYTKYVIIGRKLMKMLPGVVDDLVLAVYDVGAPKHYLDWLRSRDESFVDKLPIDGHFKRTKITKFLLTEATDGLVEDLLDLLSEPLDEQGEDEEAMDVDKSEVETQQSAGVSSYCFIDRSGNICLDTVAAKIDAEKLTTASSIASTSNTVDKVAMCNEEDAFGVSKELKKFKEMSKLVSQSTISNQVSIDEDEEGEDQKLGESCPMEVDFEEFSPKTVNESMTIKKVTYNSNGNIDQKKSRKLGSSLEWTEKESEVGKNKQRSGKKGDTIKESASPATDAVSDNDIQIVDDQLFLVKGKLEKVKQIIKTRCRSDSEHMKEQQQKTVVSDEQVTCSDKQVIDVLKHSNQSSSSVQSKRNSDAVNIEKVEVSAKCESSVENTSALRDGERKKKKVPTATLR